MHDAHDYLNFISELWFSLPTIDFNKLNNRVFIAFEFNDVKNMIPVYDIDTDIHYFGQFNLVNNRCNSPFFGSILFSGFF